MGRSENDLQDQGLFFYGGGGGAIVMQACAKRSLHLKHNRQRTRRSEHHTQYTLETLKQIQFAPTHNQIF